MHRKVWRGYFTDFTPFVEADLSSDMCAFLVPKGRRTHTKAKPLLFLVAAFWGLVLQPRCLLVLSLCYGGITALLLLPSKWCWWGFNPAHLTGEGKSAATWRWSGLASFPRQRFPCRRWQALGIGAPSCRCQQWLDPTSVLLQLGDRKGNLLCWRQRGASLGPA